MTSDKLSDRLKGMLLETTAAANNAQNPLTSSRPLIEVVHSEGEEARGGSWRSNAENVPLDSKSTDDEDDDGPPPISFHGAVTPKLESSAASNDASSSEGHSTSNSINMPSLAEQLLADATEAKQKQQQQKTQKEQRRAKKSTFGLKKGFLNSSSNDKKAGKKSGASKAGDGISKLESEKKKKGADVGQKGGEKNLIYELDNDGNMIPSSSTNNKQPPKSNPLHLPEVQSAMLSQLQSNSSQWATSDLLDSIPKQHPKLAQGMHNPRYMKALQDMQSNPKGTLDRLKKSDPEIVEWLMEFCGVMGEHFCKMGEGQQGREGDKKKEQKGVTTTASSSTAATTANDRKVREMGPLEKKALSRHKKMQTSKEDAASTKQSKERQSDSSTSTQQPSNQKKDKDINSNNGMDDQVSSILADDELRSILMDPKMQQIMEECTGGNKLRYYMSHEEYGPKLRKLIEAGLIRLG
mmetsp:Transcript_42273/g.76272  ORF Transcript_42273/g.76272 Transcript_42273/m.76272 type:complete len:466 (+) Transcript_42273:108-1505(+)